MTSEMSVKASPKPVYLIEYNHLAGIYLRNLLKPNYAVHIIRCCSDNQIRLECSSDSLVIIDAESLPFRLSECVHWVSSSFHGARILVIGREATVDDICDLIWIGMHGIISPEAISEIHSAIESVGSGHPWIRQEILEKFVCYSSVLAETLRRRHHSIITAQESRVISLLRKKYSNKEIGAALAITERTVKFHLANIFEKVGAHDRSSALDLILRGDLVHFKEMNGGSEAGQRNVIGGDLKRAGISQRRIADHQRTADGLRSVNQAAEKSAVQLQVKRVRPS